MTVIACLSKKEKVMKTKIVSLFLLVSVMMVLLGCTPTGPAPTSNVEPTQVNTVQDYAGKTVVYVNSYHEGYPWSDGIEKGLHNIFDGTGLELKIIRLDTKQHPEEAFGHAAGLKAWQEIQALQPDVVIASDDNAQKYLVVPHLKGSNIPVVFNGVNWDGSAYGFPSATITGVIEVELPDQLIELLKAYAKGERLGYITIDTETERKVVDIYNQRFFNGQMTPYWVKTQDEFKTAFLAAQGEVDILMMGNNAGSDQWQDAAMQAFILQNSRVPTGSINDWMAPYSLLTLAKSSEEQGELAAQAALQILSGTPPSEIPVVQNKKGQIIVNLELADKLGVVFAPSLLKNALIVGE
jgi:ABC-type uncharacterized transport system substrate-binding protein